MMAAPASSRAARPVITKMPAPMTAPTPSAVSATGPSTRRSRRSSSISARSVSSDFLANHCFHQIIGVPPNNRPYRVGARNAPRANEANTTDDRDLAGDTAAQSSGEEYRRQERSPQGQAA